MYADTHKHTHDIARRPDSMAKLSDFGAGVDDEPAPEDEVKINLSTWLKKHGADVYWEKRPSYGHRTFSTQSSKNPDLLAVTRWDTYAIEVKTGDDGGGIHDGVVQTERYWYDYVNADQRYFFDGSETQVDAFLLATQHAPDGRLYYRRDRRDKLRTEHVTDRFDDLEPPVKWLPDWEFYNTESLIRVLWRFAKNTKPDGDERDAIPGIGALLSKRLDGERPQPLSPEDAGPFDCNGDHAPAALYRSFDGGNVHEWWEL